MNVLLPRHLKNVALAPMVRCLLQSPSPYIYTPVLHSVLMVRLLLQSGSLLVLLHEDQPNSGDP